MTIKEPRGYDSLLTPDSASLERPVAIEGYHSLNQFRIQDGKLKIHPDARRSVLITPSNGMLEEFVALADAEDNKYLQYACKWGLLELCKEHLEPVNHNQDCEPLVPSKKVVFGFTDEPAKEHRQMLISVGEPISAWRTHARFAKALLNIAARLHQGELGTEQDWETLHFDDSGFLGRGAADWRRNKKLPDIIAFEKSLITTGVNTYWLGSGGVQPRIYWRASRPTIAFECPAPYGKLFANLAIQLMMAISQLESLAICSVCGDSYKPKRRPKANQRRYCQRCKNVAKQDASADYRRRKKAQASRGV